MRLHRAMQIKVTRTAAAFDLPEWEKLQDADSQSHIFSLPLWNRLWWEDFGAGKDLIALTFLDPDPVGLAVFMADETPEGRRLRFVGGDDLTDYLGPLASTRDHYQPIATSMLEFLEAEEGWDYLDAKCLPVPFNFAECLVEAADRMGMPFWLEQHEVTSVLPLPGGFEEYLAGLPGKSRHELRRKMRRYERDAGPPKIVTAGERTLTDDVAIFVEMHRTSGGTKGKFMREGRPGFFVRVAEAFGPEGLLSLDFLEAGGKRIAATFSFRYDGVFYLYNSAFDASAGHLSPGLVLAAGLIERSISQGMTRFDFLRGPERYKSDLGGQPLPLHSIRIEHRRRGLPDLG